MRGMALKLFRSTGYSSILSPGETRVAMHPGWLILFTSLWVGFACNVLLWRELRVQGSTGLAQAFAMGAFTAAACGAVLSLLGWRKTLKPAATLLLFVAALVASNTWGQAVPLDGGLAAMRPSSLLLPSWTSLLHWQAWATVAGLALVPAVWVSKTQVRRLPGQHQLSVNVTGILAAGAVLALSGFALFGGLI